MGNDNHFHIAFERSGGFAGIVMATEIKSDTLAIDEVRRLNGLIDASGFFTITEIPGADAGMPDGFYYKLSIERSGRLKTLEFGESAMPQQLRPLIDELTKRAKRRH